MVNVLTLMVAAQLAFICFVIIWVLKIDDYLQMREGRIATQREGDATQRRDNS